MPFVMKYYVRKHFNIIQEAMFRSMGFYICYENYIMIHVCNMSKIGKLLLNDAI